MSNSYYHLSLKTKTFKSSTTETDKRAKGSYCASMRYAKIYLKGATKKIMFNIFYCELLFTFTSSGISEKNKSWMFGVLGWLISLWNLRWVWKKTGRYEYKNERDILRFHGAPWGWQSWWDGCTSRWCVFYWSLGVCSLGWTSGPSYSSQSNSRRSNWSWSSAPSADNKRYG